MYDAAAADFITTAVKVKKQPFFFYFASHHTHAPQFAPSSLIASAKRGLMGASLGLLDRSVGRVVNSTMEF